MFEVSHKELDTILVQVGQAVDSHEQWYRQVVRTMICNLTPDERDVAENAHTLCRFGQWYYQHSSPSLRSHPTFAAIEEEHKRLHTEVARLLQTSADDMNVEVLAYDQFANTLERMRLQLYSLKHEIESDLYNRDPLTGALTRYGMLATLREQQQMADRGAGICSIVLLDIDHFKQVNDRWGHKVGDQLLTHLSSVLMNGLRSYDKLYRYGGEEFLVMLPNTAVEIALPIAERMRTSVEESPLTVDDLPLRATASFGVAKIEAGKTVETSIEQADMAMYVAKQLGRNQVKLWEPSLPTRMVS